VANKVNSVEAGIQLATDLLIQGRVRQQYQAVTKFYCTLLA
jgi:anthranilate phosphoribosyltransferase